MRAAWVVLIAGCGFQGPPVGGEVQGAPDAGFNAVTCPASYTADLPGPTRYRLINDGHPMWTQGDACAADLPGATHLVVLSSATEVAAIAALVTTPPLGIAGSAVWIGGVQSTSARQTDEGWLGLDGAPMLAAWGGPEPNDRNQGEADHAEQFVKLERMHSNLTDTNGSENLGALCECDGAAIAATAAAAITAARPGS